MTEALNPPSDGVTAEAVEEDAQTVEAAPERTFEEEVAAQVAREEAAYRARFRPMALPSTPFWLVMIAAIIIGALLIAGSSTLFMFAVGIVLTAIALPIVNLMERHGVKRTLAGLIVVGAMTLLAALVIVVFAAFVVDKGLPFLKGVPDYLTTFKAAVDASTTAPDWVKSAVDSVVTALLQAINNVDAGTVVLGVLGGVLGFVGTLLTWTLLPFFVFYMISDEPRMKQGFDSGVPTPWRPHIQKAIDITKNDFGKYFKAELIVGAIMGVTVTIGIYIIGLIVGGPLKDFAVMFGLLAAVMELVPQLGPIISMIPALLLALTISPVAFVLTGAFYLTLFTIESNLLVPSIEGDVVQFSRPAVLFLIMMGLAVGGIIGAILAIPVTAIARDLFSYLFRHAEREALMEDPGTT